MANDIKIKRIATHNLADTIWKIAKNWKNYNDIPNEAIDLLKEASTKIHAIAERIDDAASTNS